MPMIDPKKILTPTGRAILEFVQLLCYLVMGTLLVYHFMTAHTDAQAAQVPVPNTAAIHRIEHKVDSAIDAINDLRQDNGLVMDKLQIPMDQRASSKHALPASTGTTP